MSTVVAMVGTPLHWIALAAVAVILLAPQYIPTIGRILGRLFGMELKRRYGITLKSQPAPPKKETVSVTQITRDSPTQPAITREPAVQLSSTHEESLISASSHAAPKRVIPVWAGVLLVLAATTVLLWYLLHTR